MNNMSNKELKKDDIVYIDILDADNYMTTMLEKNTCLKDKIVNVTDKYIQTEQDVYDSNTKEEILSKNGDYTTFFKKLYVTKQELFAERKRLKKYKIFYEAIKNETEYASFLKKLPDEVLDVIIQQIKSQS